jgi:hypothetical protein
MIGIYMPKQTRAKMTSRAAHAHQLRFWYRQYILMSGEATVVAVIMSRASTVRDQKARVAVPTRLQGCRPPVRPSNHLVRG